MIIHVSNMYYCYSCTGRAWLDNNKTPLFLCFKKLDFVMFQCKLTKINKIVKFTWTKSWKTSAVKSTCPCKGFETMYSLNKQTVCFK